MRFNSDVSAGNGFVFHDYNGTAFEESVKEAMEAFKNRQTWLKAIQRVIRLDFSWQASA
jgi:glycogen synthase